MVIKPNENYFSIGNPELLVPSFPQPMQDINKHNKKHSYIYIDIL